MTDEKIIALMREKNEQGLIALMSKYQRLVESTAAHMLGSKEDIEEVAADTFYKIWQTSDRIDLSKGSLKNYICMVGRSITVNKLRTLSQAEQLPEEERDLGIDVDFSTAEASKHNKEIITACVRAMPSPEREIFLYRYYYSMPISRISDKLGIEERKVEYILHHCKRKLRYALTKGGILL